MRKSEMQSICTLSVERSHASDAKNESDGPDPDENQTAWETHRFSLREKEKEKLSSRKAAV